MAEGGHNAIHSYIEAAPGRGRIELCHSQFLSFPSVFFYYFTLFVLS